MRDYIKAIDDLSNIIKSIDCHSHQHIRAAMIAAYQKCRANKQTEVFNSYLKVSNMVLSNLGINTLDNNNDI